MEKAYVILKKGFEYDDNIYSESEGGSPSLIVFSKEDAKLKVKELSKREKSVESIENQWNSRFSELKVKQEELELFQMELNNLNKEIQNWEGLHWKFKRNIVPPSAIPETKSPDFRVN